MVFVPHSIETPDAAVTRSPSSGYASSLLLMQLKVSVSSITTSTAFSCPDSSTNPSRSASSITNTSSTGSSGRAVVDSAAPPPVFLESSGAPSTDEEVKTPTLNLWDEMRRLFDVAHDPATLASSDGEDVASAERDTPASNDPAARVREGAATLPSFVEPSDDHVSARRDDAFTRRDTPDSDVLARNQRDIPESKSAPHSASPARGLALRASSLL